MPGLPQYPRVLCSTRQGNHHDRVYQLFCFALCSKHSAHCAHVHMVRWAYVNNALACCRLLRCSSSSSTVSIEPNVVDRLTAISIEDLLKYPWGDKIMLWASISPFSSDFGSRPVHTRNSGLLGNGAFIVPLPAFLPSLIIHVFRKRAVLRCSHLWSIDCLMKVPAVLAGVV